MSGTATERRIPFNSLAPGIRAIRGEIDAAIARVLDSGWVLLGPELQAFEEAFAAYHGSGFRAVGVGSGTDALTIGLRALGVGPGDDVLVVANAGVPPAAAVVAAGARPVYCDVNASTHVMDPTEIDARVTPRTRAVLVVHLYGHPAPMPEIVKRARVHRLKVLEDCAQAHGARLDGQLVGTFGDAAAFSFYPTKNMGALGDAGALLTRDRETAERAKLLRMYGWREKYISELQSTVSRMDELHAAVLSIKLRHLDEWNARRRAIAQQYRRGLDGMLDLPPSDGVFHLFVVQSTQRDALRAGLAQAGVGTDVHYPLPAHLQKPYASDVQLPNTERLAQRVLSLPMYPELSDADVDYIVEVIRARHGA
ncbi:MAG: DegT/DnrJ/EryC1/StrS family aminotransferase [Chloroflexi bacterium]|nr:DegT/DnrJ/EryC1/StrS family aminotransferase [Chloroflexota bacterium]MBV9543031.1 DegT/DnrJ/EryC1/StrS family aminotransferase [Chloroflexota bacterium]